MKTLPAALCGYALDCLLGDPAALTPIHPVVRMGKGVRALEKALRERFPKTEPGELAAGTVMAALLPIGTVLSSGAILRLVRRKSPFAAFLLASVWSWQVLAAKNLRDEAKNVQSTSVTHRTTLKILCLVLIIMMFLHNHYWEVSQYLSIFTFISYNMRRFLNFFFGNI